MPTQHHVAASAVKNESAPPGRGADRVIEFRAPAAARRRLVGTALV
jgi:hypothetical protein